MQHLLKISTNTVYRKEGPYQLWAHLDGSILIIYVSSYSISGLVKTYAKKVSEVQYGRRILVGKQLLQALTYAFQLQFHCKNDQMMIKIGRTIQEMNIRKNHQIQINLNETKNQPSLSNYMMISMVEQKLNIKQQNIEQAQYEPIPICHKNRNYQFRASYILSSRTIKTSLWIEDSRGKGKKQFKNNIDEQYFSRELKTVFESLEILFEHIRNQDNYEVIFDKGRIRIINQPKSQSELSLLRRKVMHRRQLFQNSQKNVFKAKIKRYNSATQMLDMQLPMQDYSTKMEEEIAAMRQKIEKKFDKKILEQGKIIQNQESKIVARLMMELSSMEDDFSDKLYQMSKGLALNSEQKRQKKFDIEILEEWKEAIGKDIIDKMSRQDKKVRIQLINIIGEAKRQLAVIIHRLRNDFQQMIKQNEEKCMDSIDKLETDLCKKVEDITSQANSVKDTNSMQAFSEQQTGLKSLRDFDWNPIEVDPNSSQFMKFKIDLDNVIIYNSGWEWTQLFTKIIIPHGKIISLNFKILKSAYNAIAIGVSDRSNIGQKTSLSLKNSIAYWGDRELWQGKKIKEEGNGFKAGQIVTMTVDTIKGSIVWSVQSDVRAQYSSSILRDRSLHLMGYIEMYDRGDRIQLLSFRLND